MAEEKLLTIREVSQILDISEKEVVDLADNGSIPAYKVGGVYLRFKRAQVEEFKKTFKAPAHSGSNSRGSGSALQKYSFRERLSDFLYFNDFYILSFLIIILIIVIIFNEY